MADQKPVVLSPLIPSKYSRRVLLKDILERNDGGYGILGQRVVVGGWVKCAKVVGSNKDVCCVEINYREKSEAVPKQPPQSVSILTVSDGSCVASLQIIVDSSLALPGLLLPTGTCILAEGTLKKPLTPGKDLIELIVERICHIGLVYQNQCPLSTNRVPLEKLKDWSHFCPRTTTVGSITRIRSAMTFAVHSFFQNNGFFYVQLPTFTTTSADEFGKKFRVTTLDRKEAKKEQGDNRNFSKDFFSRKTYLSVSGRLRLQSYACALGNVYSCGPRFLQSSEMWMVETEIAFSQMADAIKCADDLLKFLCKKVLEDCSEDMKFDKTNIDRLQSTISSSLEKISYSETVDIFKQIADENPEMALKWGAALTTDQLSYLVDEVYKKPLIIYNYPKEVQPFYVRLNDDGKTAAGFDLIVPKAGRVIFGSQNEEVPYKFKKRMKQLNLPKEEYEWCLQLRQHGTVKHSGFSLALDSFLVFATGLLDV